MNILLANGFEKAYIGTADIKQTSTTVAVYDAAKCVEILQKRDGMNLEEAITFFDFNVKDAYVGGLTPIFVEREIEGLRDAYGEILGAVRQLESEENGVGGD